MADVEILALQVSPAPLTYSVPGGQEILLQVLAASFDGSAYGSTWQPAIQLVGPSGQVLRTFPLTPALAAGASADVTWFPGGGLSSGGTGTGGIQYDTFPQSGAWLYSETTGAAVGPNGVGTDIEDSGPGGIQLNSTGSGGINIDETGGVGIELESNGPLSLVTNGASADIDVTSRRAVTVTGGTPSGRLVFNPVGAPAVILAVNGSNAHGQLELQDSGGNAILTVHDFGPPSVETTIDGSKITLQPSGDAVISPTGATAVQIVTAGETFTVTDHLANPIFQLTG